MFCYNEYVKDIYNTNKLAHYENILRDNKFVLKSIGDKVKISDDIKAEMTDLRSQVEDTLFDEYLNAENRDIEKYKIINSRVNLLELPDDVEILTTYKNYLTKHILTI